VIRQSGKHVCEPSLRIDAVELGGLDQRVDCGGAMAAMSEPAKVQFLRPTATQRTARSAALLDMHRRPSPRKRVSAVQRFKL